jgi:hypothetical protein
MEEGIPNTIMFMLIMILGFVPVYSIVFVFGQQENVSRGTGTNFVFGQQENVSRGTGTNFADIVKQNNQIGNNTGHNMGPIDQAIEGLFNSSNGGR